jgi:pSer/pThr/pTyr-binding forkhead associated (FHA) protein
MAKLVVLSAGLAGRSCELKVDKTTIGRVEDNAFQIAEASVSSHHCEIFLRGGDVVVKDLDSTNGTFIDGDKIAESVLKPGQTLRLGQVEIRLEDGAASAAPSASPAAAPAPSATKKQKSQTTAMGGVSLNELEQGPRSLTFDTSKTFSKKSNRTNKWFLIVGVGVGVILLVVFVVTILSIKK